MNLLHFLVEFEQTSIRCKVWWIMKENKKLKQINLYIGVIAPPCHHEGVICIGFRRPQKMKKFYADVISRIITEMTSASYKVFL